VRFRSFGFAVVVPCAFVALAATPPALGQVPPPVSITFAPSPSSQTGARRELRQTIDVSRNFVPGGRAVPGPATVEYIAINPLVYPYWTLKVDNVVKSGPAFTLTGTSQTPLAAIDDGMPSPVPSPLPSGVATGSPFVGVYVPQRTAAAQLFPKCVKATLTSEKGATQIADVNTCYASISAAYEDVSNSISAEQKALTRAGQNYNSLVVRVSRLLASGNARCAVLSNPDTADARDTGDLCGQRLPSADEQVRYLDANLARSVIGANGSRGEYDPITARQVVREAARIRAWPVQEVTTLTAAVTALHDTLAALPTPSPTPKPKPTATPKTKPQPRPSALPRTSAKPKPGALRKTAPGTNTSTSARAPGGTQTARTTPTPRASGRPVAVAASPLPDPRNQCFDGNSRSDVSLECLKTLKRMSSDLAAWAKDSDEQQAFESSRKQLVQYVSERLVNLTPSRFHFADHEGCRGVNGSRRERTYTLQLDATQITSITIVCESRIFLSGGIGFSSLSQGSYTTLPDTHYASPAPAAAPTGVGVIQEVATSDIRPIPVTLVNYRLLGVGQQGEQALYTSFGLGLASSQQSTFFDYIGGISYGMSKAALVTVGAHLGQQNVLEPGYSVGQSVTGSAPQTTRNRLGWIVVFSYGQVAPK
jgi:hypothetical protein